MEKCIMKKSKILSLVLAVAMVIACFAGSISTVSADEGFTCTVGTVEAVPGATVDIPLVIANNTGVLAFSIFVEYADGLSLVSLTDGGVLGGFTPGGDVTANPYGVMWEDSLLLEGNSNNGTIGTLKFVVSEEAQAGDFLEVSIYQMFDGDGAIVAPDFSNAPIQLISGGVEVVAPATQAPATQAPATQAPAADDNANTGDSFAVFAAIAAAIVVLGAVVVVRRKKA